MKIFPVITGCMLLILVSCSSYQKVCSSNFDSYGQGDMEAETHNYVLKKRDLHYTSKVALNNYQRYNSRDGFLTDSRSAIVEDNLVIPKGARGTCLYASNDSLFIDFGEGVVIPFRIHSHDNSPANQISVDQQSFDIVVVNRTATLYFDVSNYSKSKN